LTKRAQNGEIAQAIDVDPGYKFVIEMPEEFVTAGVFALLQAIRSVLDQSDDWRFLGRILGELEHAGRFARDHATSSN
jgi:hypothetical protein